MNERIKSLITHIAPLKEQVVNHRVYESIKSIDDLKVFMQYHVYAVWDFMSLLKSLQNNLTCVQVPWFPVGSADTRYLINEIVVGEESDVDSNGNRKSHYEIYLEAMVQSGADIACIERFTAAMRTTNNLNSALCSANAPIEVRDFVNFTFDIIKGQKNHVQAAVFTFGREDLVPGMFVSLVSDLHLKFPENISIFKYYLDRHIEVDGDHHSELALQMTSNLCGDDDELWQEARNASAAALKQRLRLWDGVCAALQER